MRQIRCTFDRIWVEIEIVIGGTGQTGLTPNVAVMRRSDGNYLGTGGTPAWGAGYAVRGMTEVDATNMPGLYQWQLPASAFDTAAEHKAMLDGLVFQIRESTTSTVEYVACEIESFQGDGAMRALLAADPSGFPTAIVANGADATGLTFPVAALPGNDEWLEDAFCVVQDTTSGDLHWGQISVYDTATPELKFAGKGIGFSVASGDVLYPIGNVGFMREAHDRLEALFLALIGLEGNGLEAFRKITTADAGGTKLYSSGKLPAVARSDEYKNRLILLIDTSGGTGAPVATLLRCTGIANDGSGDHFTVTDLRGAAVSAGFGTSQQFIVTNLRDESTYELLEAPMSGHQTLGTIGDHIRRMLGLRQHELRVVNDSFHSSGQPTAGKVLVYDNAVDLAADTGPGWALATARYDFTVTYDGSGRVTDYESTRVT